MVPPFFFFAKLQFRSNLFLPDHTLYVALQTLETLIN